MCSFRFFFSLFFFVIVAVVFVFNAIMRFGRCFKSCCVFFLAFFYFDFPTQNNQENVRGMNLCFFLLFRKQKTSHILRFFSFVFFLLNPFATPNFNLIGAWKTLKSYYVVLFAVVVDFCSFKCDSKLKLCHFLRNSYRLSLYPFILLSCYIALDQAVPTNKKIWSLQNSMCLFLFLPTLLLSFKYHLFCICMEFYFLTFAYFLQKVNI